MEEVPGIKGGVQNPQKGTECVGPSEGSGVQRKAEYMGPNLGSRSPEWD